MNLEDIISADRIFLDLEAQAKPALLRDLATRLAAGGVVANADRLTEKLIERENMITTGVREGFAFPHVFSPQVSELTLTIARVAGGTDFESIDGKPVELLFLFLGPPDRQEWHLRMLARVSRIARTAGTLEALRDAKSEQSVIDFISNSDRQLTPAT